MFFEAEADSSNIAFGFKEGVFKKPVDGTTRHFERSEKSAFKHDSESPKSRFLVVPPRNDGF
ncbi:MAG: hypothetical protein Q7N50_15935, partial [Armatimonadota bacterium]|nr:hypothetical protein [Armatimonadota bacterium]